MGHNLFFQKIYQLFNSDIFNVVAFHEFIMVRIIQDFQND